MNIDSSKITVQGVSGGSYMALQLLVAYSDVFAGAELLLGGSYGSANGLAEIRQKTDPAINFDDDIKMNYTMNEYAKMLNYTLTQTLEFENSKQIAPLSNLEGKPVFIYSGSTDGNVAPWNQEMQFDFLTHFKANIKLVTGISEHHWMSPNVPYYSYQWLHTVMSKDGQRIQDEDTDWNDKGMLIKFDQRELIKPEDMEKARMNQDGWMYYPKSCVGIGAPKCSLQFVLHGCAADAMQECLNTIPIATSNQMVLVFPQVDGCWRYGEENLPEKERPTKIGDDLHKYLTREGAQMKFFKSMIDRLSQPQDRKRNYFTTNVDNAHCKQHQDGHPWSGNRTGAKGENIKILKNNEFVPFHESDVLHSNSLGDKDKGVRYAQNQSDEI